MKRVLLMVLVLIVLGGIGAFAYISLQTGTVTDAERKAAFQKTLGRDPRVVKNVGGVKSYHGPSDSFSYPAGFSPFSYVDTHKPSGTIDSFILQDRDARIFFTSEVRSLQGTLNDVPDVLLRRSQKDMYKETQQNIGGEPGVLFTKKDTDVEITAFVMKGAKLYSFSATGTDGAESIMRIVTSSVSLY